jgi:hypothetical protein
MMAEFTTPAQIMEAAVRVREAGYKWFDCCTPFAVHGLDKAMGVRPTILPVLVFFGGATGTILGFVLQWFTNAASFTDVPLGVFVSSYALLVSGKPMISLPAYIPVMFELTVLLSALGAAGWLLLLNGLPRFHHPCFTSERFLRVTDDRFFLVIEARDPLFHRTKTETLLRSLNPASIEVVEA